MFFKESTLERANRLFDSGHVLQALQLLTEQSRQAASTEVEQRLVEMRHRSTAVDYLEVCSECH